MESLDLAFSVSDTQEKPKSKVKTNLEIPNEKDLVQYITKKTRANAQVSKLVGEIATDYKLLSEISTRLANSLLELCTYDEVLLEVSKLQQISSDALKEYVKYK